MLKLKRESISATRCIALTAMLSAVSVIFQYLEFPIPFLIPDFIKMDFSDLPALIASFGMGPLPAVAVCFVKNFFHFITATTTGGVGELSNFLLSSVFVVTAGVFYHFWRSRKGALLGSLVGALAMGLLCIPINYFVTYPIYYNFIPEDVILTMYQKILHVDSILTSIVVFNFPFTFLKGALCTVIALLVYKRISPFLKGKKEKHD